LSWDDWIYRKTIKGTYLIYCIKSTSRKIIDLNAKGKIESFLEDDIGDYLHDFEKGKDFLRHKNYKGKKVVNLTLLKLRTCFYLKASVVFF